MQYIKTAEKVLAVKLSDSDYEKTYAASASRRIFPPGLGTKRTDRLVNGLDSYKFSNIF